MEHPAIPRLRRPSAGEIADAESMQAYWPVAFATAVGLLGLALPPAIVSRAGAAASGVLGARTVGP
jgi:hypothetical protein